mgnify:CR=1 FL=1
MIKLLKPAARGFGCNDGAVPLVWFDRKETEVIVVRLSAEVSNLKDLLDRAASVITNANYQECDAGLMDEISKAID